MYITWSSTAIKPKYCLQHYTSKQVMDDQYLCWVKQPFTFPLWVLNSHILSLYVTQLPETDILFGIDIQKRFSLSYSWYSDKQLFIQREGSFFTYTRHCEQQHDITVMKSTLKIPTRHNGIIPFTIKGHNLKAPMGYLSVITMSTGDLIQTSMWLIEFITSKADQLYTFL